MLKNYFVIAVRHLLRHKAFSAINILCLSIGLTFSLAIGVYALNQYGINASLKNAARQYLVKSNWKVKEMGLDLTTFGPLPKALKEEYPSLVANYYRYNPVTNVVSAGDKYFKEDIAIGDTTLVSQYGFPVLYGNPQRPFTDDNSAVITEAMAMKLFGEKNVLNKVLSILTTHNGEKQDYKVSAVLKTFRTTPLPTWSAIPTVYSCPPKGTVITPAATRRSTGTPLTKWVRWSCNPACRRKTSKNH